MNKDKPFWWPDPQSFIAVLLVLAMVVLVFVLALRPGTSPDSDIFKMVVGAFTTVGFASIINYFFGSSRGSAAKDDTINKIASDANKPTADGVKALVLIGVMALGMLAFSGDASAQTTPFPKRAIQLPIDPLGLNNRPASGSPLSNILGALDDKLLADLQYAKKLADATGSKVTAPCYQAWIDIILTRQKAVTGADGTLLDPPNPRLITDFEKAVELRNALQSDSDFMLKCSPVANMVKKDIIGFIGQVLAGGAGLATLVPGL